MRRNAGNYIHYLCKILSKLYTPINRIYMMINGVSVGRKFQCRGICFIKNNGMITIGNDVRINSSVKSNPIGGNVKTLFQVFGGGR